MVKDFVNSKDFANIGLTRLVSSTLDDSLPKAQTIRELDDNIKKYARHALSDEDIVRVAKSIAERTVKSLDNLNQLAEENHVEFINKLQLIADKEKQKDEERTRIFNDLVHRAEEQVKKMHEAQTDFKTKSIEFWEFIKQKTTNHEFTVLLNADLNEINKKLKRDNIDIQNRQRAEKKEAYIKMKKEMWRKKVG